MTAAEKSDTTPDDPPALVVALKLLREGLWPVVITSPDDPAQYLPPDDPRRLLSPGKQPLDKKSWALTPPTENAIRARFVGYPDGGVGLRLGPRGGVVDIDVDQPEYAAETLARLFPGGLPPTRGWSNAGGKFHLLFRWDDRLKEYGKAIIKGQVKDGGEIGPNPHYAGLEVRIGYNPDRPDGGQYQTVVPPSPTKGGPPRVWNGHAEILDLPESVFADLDAHASPARPKGPNVLQLFREPIPVPADLAVRVRGYLSKVEPAVSGSGGHDKTIGVACRVGPGFDLSPEQALAFLGEWNQGCQPPWSEKELAHKVEDAYRKEARRGWLLEEQRQGDANYAKEAKKRPAADRPVGDHSLLSHNSRSPVTGEATGAGANSHSSHNSQSATEEDADIPVFARLWPDPPGEAAWRGPAGELALAVDEYTEADKVGILLQAIAGFGSMVGRRVYFQVNATRHYGNLFLATVGPTGIGRKGTAWDIAHMVLSGCDPIWALSRIKGGLVSGEGLIWEVRDAHEIEEEIREKGQPPRREMVLKDAGVEDKRLLCVETELGGMLKILTREGNNLSAVIRQAWESGLLRSLAKNNRNQSTDAHVTIIGHVTEVEVGRLLSQLDAANGFANRFLWAAVRQSKFRSKGGAIPADAVAGVLEKFRAAHRYATQDDSARIERDEEAESYWDAIYRPLAEGRAGLIGAITSRAAPQTMRLAMLYALLDCSPFVKRTHLESAYELWKFCERSALYIFGDSLGDPDADDILSALRCAPGGLSQTDISVQVFKKHKRKDAIARALGRLLESGRVRFEVEATDGRSRTRWYATMGDE